MINIYIGGFLDGNRIDDEVLNNTFGSYLVKIHKHYPYDILNGKFRIKYGAEAAECVVKTILSDLELTSKVDISSFVRHNLTSELVKAGAIEESIQFETEYDKKNFLSLIRATGLKAK